MYPSNPQPMTQSVRLLLSAPLALALLISSSAGVYAQNINTDTAADIRVDTGGVLNASSSVGGSADVSADADAETANDDINDIEATSSGSDRASFSLNRDDAAVTNSTGTAIAASSVNTASDLEAYAAATMRTSDRIEGVEVADEHIVLRFTEEARLLGFIPHTMTSRVEVETDGTVRVVRPWYGFLVSGISADATADLEARVQAALGEERGSSGALSTRTQALVLAEVARALGSAEVNATTSGSIEGMVEGAISN